MPRRTHAAVSQPDSLTVRFDGRARPDLLRPWRAPLPGWRRRRPRSKRRSGRRFIRTRCTLRKSLTEFEVPRRLRAFLRAQQSSLVLLAAVVGGLARRVGTLMGRGGDL